MTSFNIMRCFNAMWRGAFYILVLEKPFTYLIMDLFLDKKIK